MTEPYETSTLAFVRTVIELGEELFPDPIALLHALTSAFISACVAYAHSPEDIEPIFRKSVAHMETMLPALIKSKRLANITNSQSPN